MPTASTKYMCQRDTSNFNICVSCFFFPLFLQRFKGTEPVEEVTEQVKAVKIDEKPKEVKTEVVDEVQI